MTEQPRRVYQFGTFSIDATKRLLRRAGETVTLTPKVLETLLVFIESPGRVLSKDELLVKIWGDTSVEEGGLARNISILRKALGERPDDHQYIMTVPGRGYQWVADVRELQVQDSEEFETAVPRSQRRDFRPGAMFPAYRWRILAGLIALGIGVFVYVLIQSHVRAGLRPDIKSVAVLPLQNLSGDPSQEYAADGLTEALIGSLAQIRALRVVSRTSVMRFKGSKKPLSEIAHELDVDAVVSGSFQESNGHVKIMIQLIHGSTDTLRWASEYQRELPDILTLHGEVARAVAEEIQVQVTAEDRSRMRSATAVNPAAYQEYLKGRYLLWKYIEEDRQRAIGHFQRAIEIDPNYAPAYAALSHAWWTRGVLGPLTLKEVESPARRAAQKALELDDRLAEAYASQAYLQGIFDWDWTGAELTIKRALDLDPNSLDVHYVYAMLLMALGRLSEAKVQIESAAQLDPLSAQVQSSFGRILYRAREFDEAILRLNQAIELEPRNNTAISRLGDVYNQMGRHADAIAQYEKATNVAHNPRITYKIPIAQVYARMGRRSEARRMLEDVGSSPPPIVSAVWAVLGDTDEAFRRLFQAVDERSDWPIFIKTDPPFDTLHSDPRWNELLRRMNLLNE